MCFYNQLGRNHFPGLLLIYHSSWKIACYLETFFWTKLTIPLHFHKPCSKIVIPFQMRRVGLIHFIGIWSNCFPSACSKNTVDKVFWDWGLVLEEFQFSWAKADCHERKLENRFQSECMICWINHWVRPEYQQALSLQICCVECHCWECLVGFCVN